MSERIHPVKITLTPHSGGPCPVDGTSILKFRDGSMFIVDIPKLFCWSHSVRQNDIIAYCPIEIKEG